MLGPAVLAVASSVAFQAVALAQPSVVRPSPEQ